MYVNQKNQICSFLYISLITCSVNKEKSSLNFIEINYFDK